MSHTQFPAYDEQARQMRRIISYGIVAVIATIGIAIGLSIYFHGIQPGPWNGYPFFFGFGWLWVIFPLFFAFWFLRWVLWTYPHSHWGQWDTSPVQILRERYARGEITKEEFDRMMQDLRRVVPREAS